MTPSAIGLKNAGLQLPTAEEADLLQKFFLANQFTPEGVMARLETDQLPSRRMDNLPLLLYRTRAVDSLNLLIRVMVLGESIDASQAKNTFPEDVHRLLISCGLLAADGDQLIAPVRLSPFEKLWIVTDTYAKLAKGTGEDDVLMLNNTTLFLLNMAIRTPVKSLLDLGTGCGVVALEAAVWADQITAIDITERSCAFAAFNARLNSINNSVDSFEVLCGDAFAPIAGRRFDSILANPPFYVTPSGYRVFAENPLELDGFCRHVVKQGTQHLEEGGYLQMLCEWVEIEGENWRDRLLEWVADTGCDAVIFTGSAYEPAAYASVRIPVVRSGLDQNGNLKQFQEWVDYYRSHKVKAIHSGFVALRRRPGKNWVRFQQVGSEPSLQCGESIEGFFQRKDHPFTDDQLLQSKVRIADGIQIQQVLQFSGSEWQQARTGRLMQSTGLRLHHDLSPDVAGFVTGLDGERPLSAMIDQVAAGAPVPRDVVTKECLGAIRNLLDHGFLVVGT